MGHKTTAIAEKHCKVRPIDLLRQWHEKIEAWILEEAKILNMKLLSQSGNYNPSINIDMCNVTDYS
jgi:hypothetical protein